MKGSLYKRDGSPYYWAAWTDNNGKLHRKSTKETRHRDAMKFLKDQTSQFIRITQPKSTAKWDEILKDYVQDLKFREKTASLQGTLVCMNHLTDFFGKMKPSEIKTRHINEYKIKRRGDNMANASINRELMILSSAMKLAFENEKLSSVPTFHTLPEHIRQDFFTYSEFINFIPSLPDWIQDICKFAYYTGWRKGEIINLTWERTDRKKGFVFLKTSKTGKPRRIKVSKSIRQMISRIWMNCKKDENNEPLLPWVFLDTKRNCKIGNFRKDWIKACKKNGYMLSETRPSKNFHGFRRSFARNAVSAGIPEKIIMETAGWRSRQIFDRYNIVNESDIANALDKMEKVLTSEN